MTERLDKIFSVLPSCKTFIDVGCDHGYVSLAMLKTGKCESAVFTDVSAACLSKAEKLLTKFVNSGKAKGYVTDGFCGLESENADLALIAGMGGEEIINILSAAKTLPEKLCLQPMKNSDKVRAYAKNEGYKAVKDGTFKAGGKFYDLMLFVRGNDEYTEEEIYFGKDNVKGDNPDFKEKAKKIAESLEKAAQNQNVKEETKKELFAEAKRWRKYVN